MSNIGDQVWLITSRQTEPDLGCMLLVVVCLFGGEDVQLVDVGVEDTVYESDAGRFVGVLIGEFDMNFPKPPLKWSCFR